MSSLTQISSLPYPALTDPPNVPSDMSNLAAALDHLVIPKYASAAAQAAANPAPSDGDFWYRTDQSQGYVQRGLNTLVLGDSMSKIQEQTLASNTTMTFSSIPQYFKHLRLYLVCASVAGSAHVDLKLNFNGDVSSTYNYHFFYANNSVTTGSALAVDAAAYIDIGATPAGVTTLGAYGTHMIDVFMYSSTTLNKAVQFSGHASGGYNSPANYQEDNGGGLYGNTTAITSLTIASTSSNNLAIGSYGILYGLG